MHHARSSWKLTDVLWNFDPFTFVEHFGPALDNKMGSPMSSWFSECNKECCAHEYI